MNDEMDTQWPDGLEQVVSTKDAEVAELEQRVRGEREEAKRFIRDFQRMMESVEENGG